MTNTRARRVAWVAGASSGLGKATALALNTAGWQVAAGARSFKEAAPPEGGLVRLPLDVTDQTSVDTFAAEALSRLGPPDALVLAAGILILGPAGTLKDDELQSVLDVCLLGTLRLVRAALPLMTDRGGGKIAVFSSINGLLPTPFQGAYVAAKHALEGYCECLRMENRNHGIQVMLVEPGDHSGGAQEYRGQAREVPPRFRESLQRVRNVIARDESGGLSPRKLGAKVARALDKKNLPMRLAVAPFTQRAAVVLHDILPNRLFLYLISKYYRV
ncbi:MAG: SDR family NAD(P)-dependent oxidoreductase [Eubacteriales bacterium]|nr:SDR family NAD(P)-dependent oxidoreductase [Eubacteriales bacterium]